MNTLLLATTGEVYLEEAQMIERKQTQESTENTAAMGIPLGSAFVKEAERWMGAHKDFLTSMEAMMTDWLRWQREVFDTSSRSIRKIYDSRNIIDLVQAQHEWVSDCLQLTASEIRAVGNDTAALTRKATERLGEAARERSDAIRQQGKDKDKALAETATTAPMQRTAAE
jgi:hypothetical protein